MSYIYNFLYLIKQCVHCCILGLLPSTENDVKSFARETVVGGFLGVTVRKGSQLVRKKDDSKLHHSYEVHKKRQYSLFLYMLFLKCELPD